MIPEPPGICKRGFPGSLPACFVFSLEPGARIKDTRSVGEVETREGHESRRVRIRTMWTSGGCGMTKIEKTLGPFSTLPAMILGFLPVFGR
jgi:hypothetical protein